MRSHFENENCHTVIFIIIICETGMCLFGIYMIITKLLFLETRALKSTIQSVLYFCYNKNIVTIKLFCANSHSIEREVRFNSNLYDLKMLNTYMIYIIVDCIYFDVFHF